jgi:hypothetical protein
MFVDMLLYKFILLWGKTSTMSEIVKTTVVAITYLVRVESKCYDRCTWVTILLSFILFERKNSLSSKVAPHSLVLESW